MELIAVILLTAGFICFGISAIYFGRESHRLRAENNQLRDLLALAKAYPERIREMGRGS